MTNLFFCVDTKILIGEDFIYYDGDYVYKKHKIDKYLNNFIQKLMSDCKNHRLRLNGNVITYDETYPALRNGFLKIHKLNFTKISLNYEKNYVYNRIDSTILKYMENVKSKIPTYKEKINYYDCAIALHVLLGVS